LIHLVSDLFDYTKIEARKSEWSFDQEVEKPDLEFQLWGDPEGLSGAFLYNVEFDLKTARFNLELQLWDDPEGFGGVFSYKSDLFAAATIARMAGHFQTLLQVVVACTKRGSAPSAVAMPAKFNSAGRGSMCPGLEAESGTW